MKTLMKTCRDCYYGFTSLNFGTISCMKKKVVLRPEQANICDFYRSMSKKEILLWKNIMKDFYNDKTGT